MERSLQLFTMTWLLPSQPSRSRHRSPPDLTMSSYALVLFNIAMAYFGSLVRWPTSTIPAHCCSAKFFFFSAEHFSTLPPTFRLCRAVVLLYQAFLFYSKRFFCSPKQFLAMLGPFLLCQPFFFCARLGSVKHILAMLSTFRLYQTF